jgi:CMP-N-acetylneuraminic acid synthetase
MITLAVIPARAGSKGIARKNLRMVGGRSLLQRAVEAAIGCGVVDRVLVSTDDPEIQKEGLRFGAEVPFLRPAALATDSASTVEVVVHAISEYERLTNAPVGTVVLLEPTSPFRQGKHVQHAVEQYRTGCYKAVVTVCQLERKPENIFLKHGTAGGLQRYIQEPRRIFTRRQDMEQLCRVNSAVYVCGRDAFLTERAFLLEPMGYVEMTHRESVNIDEELDLLFADLIAKEYGL